MRRRREEVSGGGGINRADSWPAGRDKQKANRDPQDHKVPQQPAETLHDAEAMGSATHTHA
jgi:hypothetical protein